MQGSVNDLFFSQHQMNGKIAVIDKPKSFITYSGAVRAYSIHTVDYTKPQCNPFSTEKWEFTVAMFEKDVQTMIDELVKLGLIVKPEQFDRYQRMASRGMPVLINLTNHNSFVVWIRHKYSIDLLQLEKQMNQAYMEYMEEDESDDSDDTYIVPTIGVTSDTPTVQHNRSLTVIHDEDDNDDSDDSDESDNEN